VLATATGVMLIWAGLGYHLQSRQDSIREQTHRDVMNLSIGVEKHVERLLAGVDQVMRFVAEDFRSDPETFDFVAWARRSTSLEGVVTQISRFNEAGELVATRSPVAPDLPRFNVRDRAYFQALSASSDIGLYVDRTLKGRITGKNALQTARRLSYHDGSFAGVIVTSIDPDYLSNQFKAVDVGAQGSIGLFGHDGYIRARYPQSDGMYERNVLSLNTGKGVFAHLKEKPAGTYEVESAFDHVTRVFGYRTVGSLPLIVTVGKSLDEVMIPFQAERRRAIVAGLSITALLIAFLVFRLRARARDRRYAAALADANRTLSEKERLARAAEAHYRVLAENTSELIILGHDDGRRSYISPASERLLGFTPDELAAMSLRDYIHPEDQAILFAATRRLGHGEAQVTCVYRALTKSGAWIWVEGSFRRIPDAKADEASIVATFRDVTERNQQARLLMVARSQAEAAVEAKSEFLASMSHELRTPLNSIIGFSGLMLDSPGPTPDLMRRYARLVQDASTTLLSIVNDVLDLSKLEAGGFELDPHPFAPRELIEGSAALLRQQADAKGLALQVEVDPSVPECVIGDDTRLRQVLLNLLSNAIKFTAKGRVSVFVECEGERETQALIRFTVVDTGIGIPQDKRHRLFQRFSQVDSSTARKFGGTGLGLAICKNLVEAMGGTIKVESTEGEGSTFSFLLDLPVVAVAAAAAAEITPPHLASITQRARILLAEDVVMNQELVVTMLTRWGHTVDVVSDGAAAVDAVMRSRYDLVLMDVQMPVMGGLEATRRIRQLGGAFKHLPILAMTASVMARDVEAGRAAGANAHVGKPFVPENLRATVAHWSALGQGEFEAETLGLEAVAVHDQTNLAAIQDMAGAAAVVSLLDKFLTDLDSRMATEPGDADGWRIAAGDAHAIVSSAGMLGFIPLSEACRTLEHLCGSEPADEQAARRQLQLVHTQMTLAKEAARSLQVNLEAQCAA
jgi:PAS domain S-box-containing protein